MSGTFATWNELALTSKILQKMGHEKQKVSIFLQTNNNLICL